MTNTKQRVLVSDELVDVAPMKKPKKAVFKPYCQDQEMLLPKSVNELLPSGHICYLISAIIDRMDISHIESKYLGGGASAFEPRMMLKAWILGFVDRIYTNRPLAKAVRQDIAYIWISGNQTPDFHTLNNFRLRLKCEIKAVFKQVVRLGLEMGLIQGKDIFVDHTKKEANANKHKMVWRKQVDRQLDRIDAEVDALFKHIDQLNEEEDKQFSGKDLPEMERNGFDKGKINLMVEKLNEKIRQGDISKEDGKEFRKELKRTSELLSRKAEYLSKRKILGNRNSYSKTDTDAVAMMMKDKLSIKPAYNEGIAVENGFVVNYELSNNGADNASFIPLMKGTFENLGKKPETTTADQAYGTEDDYTFLEQNRVDNFVKYNLFHKEKSKAWREKKLRFNDFIYDENTDSFRCKNNETLTRTDTKHEESKLGYVKEVSIYEAKPGKCSLCPFKDKCTTADARSLNVSWEYERHKEKARLNLESARGKQLRQRRGNEVESVFGDSKLNKNHRRYVLRGIKKVDIEVGLHYIAHNLKKISAFLARKAVEGQKTASVFLDLLIFSKKLTY